jgi:hypothetical protein
MIRTATIDDLDRLVQLAEVMHCESPRFAILKFDANVMRSTLASVIDAPRGFAQVFEVDGVVQGALLGVLTGNFGSNDLTACDVAFFIAPEHRGGMAAVRLLMGYSTWATARGGKHVLLGLLTDVQTEKTARLCEVLGWRRAGVVMEFPCA